MLGANLVNYQQTIASFHKKGVASFFFVRAFFLRDELVSWQIQEVTNFYPFILHLSTAFKYQIGTAKWY